MTFEPQSLAGVKQGVAGADMSFNQKGAMLNHHTSVYSNNNKIDSSFHNKRSLDLRSSLNDVDA